MHGDYNVIVVDWSGGNKPPYYQATSNTRVVGAEVALVVQALEVGIFPYLYDLGYAIFETQSEWGRGGLNVSFNG